jgi:tetratricopeptide (TPR) repeat protein
MNNRLRFSTLLVVASVSVSLVSCDYIGTLQAKKVFKDANNLYSRQEYRAAAERYEEVISNDPNLTTAYFYLGNSYDNLYKASAAGEPENDSFIQSAIENYRISSERETNPALRKLSLQYLAAAFGPDKLNDPGSAEPIVRNMIELEPNESGNYFVLSKIYEDSGRYEEAEGTLNQAKDANPNDPAVYLQLAGFYNRLGEFELTIEALTERAMREETNPEAYYTIATFYWEKAFRDFRLTDEEKLDYIVKGLEAVDKAIDLKDDYMEALTYKNILLRMEANLEEDQDRVQALIAEADELRDRAEELRAQAAGTAS